MFSTASAVLRPKFARIKKTSEFWKSIRESSSRPNLDVSIDFGRPLLQVRIIICKVTCLLLLFIIYYFIAWVFIKCYIIIIYYDFMNHI